MVVWDHFIGRIIDIEYYALVVNKLCLWPVPLFNRICIIIMPQTVFIYELKTIVNNSAMDAYRNKEKQRLNHKQK